MQPATPSGLPSRPPTETKPEALLSHLGLGPCTWKAGEMCKNLGRFKWELQTDHCQIQIERYHWITIRHSKRWHRTFWAIYRVLAWNRPYVNASPVSWSDYWFETLFSSVYHGVLSAWHRQGLLTMTELAGHAGKSVFHSALPLCSTAPRCGRWSCTMKTWRHQSCQTWLSLNEVRNRKEKGRESWGFWAILGSAWGSGMENTYFQKVLRDMKHVRNKRQEQRSHG